ncbi:MAG: ABC transporter ATP-binding protein [Bacteroidota bacterium]
MILLSNYSKAYVRTTVLSIKNLKIEPGLHLVQGANGSGKTTFFKSISGIISFKGDCSLNGQSIKKDAVEYRRYVNYCEAEPNFPHFLNGRELISFVSKAKNTPDTTLHKIVMSFGVEKFWKKPIATYSSGMLKKTSLVLAFAGNPRVILLDEPFTTIDRDSKEQLCLFIREYRALGCTFLISAHQEPKTISLEFDSTLILENNTVNKLL